MLRYILFDCSVRVDPLTGSQDVDFSAYDTVFGCPAGAVLGLYLDEYDFSSGVRCVGPYDDREALAPMVRFLDGLFEYSEGMDRQMETRKMMDQLASKQLQE